MRHKKLIAALIGLSLLCVLCVFIVASNLSIEEVQYTPAAPSIPITWSDIPGVPEDASFNVPPTNPEECGLPSDTELEFIPHKEEGWQIGADEEMSNLDNMDEYCIWADIDSDGVTDFIILQRTRGVKNYDGWLLAKPPPECPPPQDTGSLFDPVCFFPQLQRLKAKPLTILKKYG